MFSIALARIIYKFRFNKHTPENELLIFKKHMHVNSPCIYRCRGEVFFWFLLGAGVCLERPVLKSIVWAGFGNDTVFNFSETLL